jgi:hypothetical protein
MLNEFSKTDVQVRDDLLSQTGLDSLSAGLEARG